MTKQAKDEVTRSNLTNMSLNIDLDVYTLDENNPREISVGFQDSGNYSICIFPPEAEYKVNAIAEYSATEGLTDYTDRKYYLDNLTLTNNSRNIDLFNLESTETSPITLTVFDQSTGANVPDAFVKILRYYPETGNYEVVEIEKTDETGQTLGKMVLADVFYKFIVETDRQVRLDSQVQKILSLSKLLPINLAESVLTSFAKIGDVSTSVSCSKSTSVCRFTWSDGANLVQDALFEVWRINGFGSKLIYSDTTSASAGTMVYAITEPVEGNTYNAVGFIETNTKYSKLPAGEFQLNYKEGLGNWGGSTVVLFSLMLLMLVVMFALVDIGAIGMIVGSLIVLIGAFMMGALPMTITFIAVLVTIGAIIIGRMRQ